MIAQTNKAQRVYRLPAFAFLNDLERWLLNPTNFGKKPKFSTFKLQGGRFSGKSFQVRDFFTDMLCATPKTVMYIVRGIRDDCERDFQTLVKDMKLKFGEEFFADNFKLDMKPNFTISYGKYNQIIFEVLNDEKQKTEKGGKLSAVAWNGYENILIFGDEMNQISKKLFQQFKDTVRGLGARQLIFQASNPWDRSNWYIAECWMALPEDEKALLEKGYQFKRDPEKKEIILRANYRINKIFIDNNPDTIKGIEDYKKDDYNLWRIVSLGLAGQESGQIYYSALQKALPPTTDYCYSNPYNVMGIDFGFSRSKTVAVFGSFSQEHGFDAIAEWYHLNEEIRGFKKLNRDEQIDEIIKFAKKHIQYYRKRIVAYVDNGYNDDMFYEIWNSRLSFHGLSREWLEFFPAEKIETNTRITTLNICMGMGLVRISQLLTPKLYEALMYCYKVEKKTRAEDDTLKRSHEWTDPICALEYAFSNCWDWLFLSDKKYL